MRWKTPQRPSPSPQPRHRRRLRGGRRRRALPARQGADTRAHDRRARAGPQGRVQDLRYHYDPSGNITRIRDDAQQGVFFANAYADPTQSFTYDPIYRLTQATGREHATLVLPTPGGFLPIAHPQNTQAQQNYTQTYVYDPVGNILRMIHTAPVAWQRAYDYHPGTNRLRATSLPGNDLNNPATFTALYTHDAHGNMTAIAQIPGGMTWDHADRLQQTGHLGGGSVYYLYDATGQRVRKVHLDQQGKNPRERIYIGPWETYRERKNKNTNKIDLERETLHVHDPAGRTCLIETKTREGGNALANPTPRRRFQYSNHLSTATLELTELAEVISYEEFHPYGTSSYRAANNAIDVSPKRYRYTGQERDEETGLAYHSARYYAPWLARWTAADPLGLEAGVNRFAYCTCSPAGRSDPEGKDEEEKAKPKLFGYVSPQKGETPEQVYRRGIQEVFKLSDAEAEEAIAGLKIVKDGKPFEYVATGEEGEVPLHLSEDQLARITAIYNRTNRSNSRLLPSVISSAGSITVPEWAGVALEVVATAELAYTAAALSVAAANEAAYQWGARLAERGLLAAEQGFARAGNAVRSFFSGRGVATQNTGGSRTPPPSGGGPRFREQGGIPVPPRPTAKDVSRAKFARIQSAQRASGAKIHYEDTIKRLEIARQSGDYEAISSALEAVEKARVVLGRETAEAAFARDYHEAIQLQYERTRR